VQPLHLRLPATSANLGPGFDALGLAMSFYLTIDAEEATAFSIDASGRNADLCGSLDRNLILDTYGDVLTAAGRPVQPLSLRLQNEIPLGMGCGSSAAALLAGVLLANHFGELGWTGYQAMEEACRREGHPDNVAACWLGGMTVSAATHANPATIATACFANAGERSGWKLLLVIPGSSLSTEKARALLPETYSRADAVTNVQNTALLVAAFAQGRADLLRSAMQDRIHQPYRAAVCPLLRLLLPLGQSSKAESEQPSILGVALSGAGPSVLLIYQGDAKMVRQAVVDRLHGLEVELLEADISRGTTFEVTNVPFTNDRS